LIQVPDAGFFPFPRSEACSRRVADVKEWSLIVRWHLDHSGDQALLALRWFRDRTRVEALGRDHGVSRATAHRYVTEAVDVLSAQAPDLPDALERAMAEGIPYVILDGKVFAGDRCSEPALSAKGQLIDAWYSGKAHRHGGTSRPSPAPTASRSGPAPPSPARSTT
jgi:hypothetical protein